MIVKMPSARIITYAADFEKLGYTKEEWYEMWYRGQPLVEEESTDEQPDEQLMDERYSAASEVS